MKIMKIISLLSLLIFSAQIQAQSEADWDWYEPAVFGNVVQGLEQETGGDIWMASGTKIIKYDGANWIAFDVLDSGLPLPNAYPKSIDASLGNIIWVSTRNRVLEYNLDTNQWTIHDPTNGAVNINGSRIKVESEDRIWWTSSYRLWEYDGAEWTAHNFYEPGISMNANSLQEIEIDNNNSKWMTTLSSVCFDVPCFTPAGVIRLTDTDTTLFDGETYGFPEARVTHIDLDSNNDLFLAFTEFSTENFYMTYTNGQWSAPVQIPFDGFLYHMRLGSEDEIYLVFSEFMAIGENGNWDVVPLDTSKITYVSTFLLTPENNIYIGGRRGYTSANYAGVLGFLPHLNYRVRGLLYSDRNYNGTFDQLEDQVLKHHFVRIVNEDLISFSNKDGAYSLLFSEPDTYGIEGLLPLYHSYSIPANGIHDVVLTMANPTSDNNDIGFKPDTSAIDLSVALTAMSGANPGFLSCYKISVKNNAPRLTEGEVAVTFDDMLLFESSDVTPSSVNGNQVTFDLEEMDWLEIKNIQLCFSLPPDPELIGDTLKYIGTIIPSGGMDLTFENNTDSLCQLITGPYDPNFIAVRPIGEGLTGDIPGSTQRLEYTIHFQNIGTDTARNVVVSHPIDINLDLFSLNVIGYSHEYDLSFIEEDRILRWSFDNINLPDSLSNEAESNGFIKYVIDLANHDIGTFFTNQADIFFDFNLPISTNTTVNTLIKDTNGYSTSNNSPVCEGADVFLTATGGDSYEWSGPNGFASSDQNPVLYSTTLNMSGTYTVTINNDSCIIELSTDVIINNLPDAIIEGDLDVCEGDSTDLIVSGGSEYLWSTNDTTRLIAVSTADNYSVTLTDDNGCSDTASVSVIVDELPPVALSIVQDTFCINEFETALIGGTPVGGIYNGPGVSNNFFDPSVAGLGIHTISYTFTDSTTNCSNFVEQEVIVIDNTDAYCLTTVHSIEDSPMVKVFPNPSNGDFTILLENWTGEVKIQIFDIKGREIYFDESIANLIPIQNIPKGIFMLKLSNHEYSSTQKLIVP